jgi:hypothetical protein
MSVNTGYTLNANQVYPGISYFCCSVSLFKGKNIMKNILRGLAERNLKKRVKAKCPEKPSGILERVF